MKVIFPIETYRKLRAYVEQIDIEISGMGKVIRERDGDETILRVVDVRIFKQTVSGTHATLDAVALGKFYSELGKEEEKPSDWKLWWHSHHTMGAFFSGIDTTTIEEWDTESLENNWMLSLVTTHQEDTSVRCDIFQPIRTTVECEIEFDYGDKEIREEAKKEIEEKVKEPSVLRGWWRDLKNAFIVEEEEKEVEIPKIQEKAKPKLRGHARHKKRSKLNVIN